MKNRAFVTRVLFLAAVSVAFTGCSKAAKKAWVTQAPANSTETGYIVHTESKAAVDQLLARKGARARVLSETHGLYEIYDVSEQTIADALPGAEIEANRFYADLVPSPLGSIDDQEGTDPVLQDCNWDDKENAPTPVIDAVDHSEVTNQQTIYQLGDVSLKFSGSRSTTQAGTTDGLTLYWVIQAPMESEQNVRKSVDSIQVTPDLPGEYKVNLVAKDAGKHCGLATIRFGITYNEPYKGPGTRRAWQPGMEEKFKHLPVIDAINAWKTTQGEGVKIAVIDTGVSYNHVDLSPNIFVNTKLTPGKNDTNGWDFVNSDAFPCDDHGHGSHASGLAAGALAGVAPKATIIPVKSLNALGGGDLASIKAGIMYAADVGADIISMSLGFNAQSAPPQLKSAIDYAERRGALIVTAAGNGDENGIGQDNDLHPHFPSSLPNDAVFAIAATDLMGALTEYSNYGKVSVDVAAPGGENKPGLQLMAPAYVKPEKGLYQGMAGTSMATPVVSGIAALVKSQNPRLRGSALKAIVMRTVTQLDALRGKLVSEGLVNAKRAVDAAR